MIPDEAVEAVGEVAAWDGQKWIVLPGAGGAELPIYDPAEKVYTGDVRQRAIRKDRETK